MGLKDAVAPAQSRDFVTNLPCSITTLHIDIAQLVKSNRFFATMIMTRLYRAGRRLSFVHTRHLSDFGKKRAESTLRPPQP